MPLDIIIDSKIDKACLPNNKNISPKINCKIAFDKKTGEKINLSSILHDPLVKVVL